MNLSTLKASADLAKTSPLNRDEWGEDIDPDDVLRLVEVARVAIAACHIEEFRGPDSVAVYWAKERLRDALGGIEP